MSRSCESSTDEPSPVKADEVKAHEDVIGADAVLDAAGQALFRLGRLFSRQPLQAVLDGRSAQAVELSRVLVVQAVTDEIGSATGPDEPSVEVTVGVIAERLGIDPSTASRLVAETVREGFLARSASAVDARRACLVVTEDGRALDAASRRFQRQVFEQATHGWSQCDRQAFARLFVRFAASVGELRAGQEASRQPGEEQG
jgi:DNA-binding MarR family transcriptional regulator